jgi:hypothetical protein
MPSQEERRLIDRAWIRLRTWRYQLRGFQSNTARMLAENDHRRAFSEEPS